MAIDSIEGPNTMAAVLPTDLGNMGAILLFCLLLDLLVADLIRDFEVSSSSWSSWSSSFALVMLFSGAVLAFFVLLLGFTLSSL